MNQNTQNVQAVQAVQVPIKEAIFIHKCCGSGLKFFKAWVLEHPDVKMRNFSMFKAKEKKLDEKYGFQINDLHKHSFIFFEGNLIKGDN